MTHKYEDLTEEIKKTLQLRFELETHSVACAVAILKARVKKENYFEDHEEQHVKFYTYKRRDTQANWLREVRETVRPWNYFPWVVEKLWVKETATSGQYVHIIFKPKTMLEKLVK